MRKFKKTSGLLAFVIVFSMIASLIVMPVSVSAASENLAGTITGVSENTLVGEGIAQSADGFAPKWSTQGTATFTFDNGIVSVSNRAANNASAGPRLDQIGLESGKTYKISADFRRDSDISGGTARVRFYFTNTQTATNKCTYAGGDNIAQEGGMIGETPATVGKQVELENKDQWYTLESIFTLGTDETKELEKGIHIGFKLGQNSNSAEYNYSFRNFRIVEVTALTGSAVANSSNDGATFTFSNIIATATTADFEVTTTATGAATPELTVVPSGNVVEVTMTGATAGTAYTITAKADGLADEFGQKLAAPVSATVTTTADEFVPAEPGTNLAGTVTGVTNNEITATGLAKATADSPEPKWVFVEDAAGEYENGAVKVTQRKSTTVDGVQKGSASSGVMISNLGVQSGKTYYVEGELRADGNVPASLYYGRFYIAIPQASLNKVTLESVNAVTSEANSVTNNVALTSDGAWHKAKGIFTLGADNGTKELGVSLGVKVGANANAYDFPYSVRNVKVIEISPFTATAEAKGTTGATFTFSNNVASATAADFEVTTTATGAATPELTVAPSGKTVEVTMTGATAGTAYIITAKADGVADEYGQKLAAPVSATVTTAAAAVDPATPGTNLVGTITGVTGNTINATGMVKSPDGYDPAWTIEGSSTLSYADGVLSVSGRAANNAVAGPKLGQAGIVSGKTYMISADFRRDSDLSTGTSRVRFSLTPAQASQNKACVEGGTNINDGTVANQAGMKGETPAQVKTASNPNGQFELTNKGEWYTVKSVFTMGADATKEKEMGVHIGIKAGQNSNSAEYNYSMRNFKLVEVTPFTVSSSSANSDNDGVTFTFSNNVASATNADFEVTTEAVGAEIPTLTVVLVDNTCKVTMVGATPGTEYTIKAKANGVTDEFGQKLAAPVSATVTTEAAIVTPVVGENLAGTITGVNNNVLTATGIKPSADGIAPAWTLYGTATVTYEDGIVSVKDRTANSTTSGPRLDQIGLESGKTYKISADFRRDSDIASGTTSRVRFCFTDTQTATNRATIAGGTNINQGEGNQLGMKGETPAQLYHATNNPKGQRDLTNKGEWYTVESVFTLGVNEEKTAEKGIHISLKLGQNSNAADYDYSFKNFKIVEVTPFAGVALANSDKDGATFTFTNEIATATAEDFEVTTTAIGAKTPTVSVTKNGKVCEVKLSNYSGATIYTITAKANGVTDEFGQTLSSPISAIVTTEAAAVITPMDGNIAPVITGVSGTTLSFTGGEKASDDAAALEVVGTKGTEQFTYSDGVLSVHRTAAESASGLYIKNLGVKSGKTYRITAEVRRDTDVTGVLTARFYLVNPNTTQNKASAYGGSGISENTENYTAGEIHPATTLTNQGEWYTVTNDFTLGVNAGGAKELGMHLGIKVGSNGNATSLDYSIRNLKVLDVEQIPPEFKVTSDLASGEGGVGTEKDITLTFTNAPESFTTSNIELKKGSETVTTGIAVSKVDDTTYKVSLSDLENSADYTLKISGVMDSYYQTIDDFTIAFSTSALVIMPGINLLEGTTIDYSFENMAEGAYRGDKGESTTASAETYTIVSSADAKDGSKMLLIEGAEDATATMQRFNQIPDLLVEGNKYEVSAWVKAVDTTEAHEAVSVYVAPWGRSKLEAKNIQKVSVVPDGTWQKITATFTTGIRDINNPDNKFHIGVTRVATCTADLYVDHYEVKRIVDPLTITSNIENGASEVSLTPEFNIAFNNPVPDLTAANVKLYQGATEITEGITFTKVDEYNYKVAVAGLAVGKNYKLKFNNVADIFSQELTNSEIAFTTVASINLVEANGLDWSFEAGRTYGQVVSSSWAYESTARLAVVNGTDERVVPTHGSKMLKLSNRSVGSTYRIVNIGKDGGVHIEPGKIYKFTMDVRTAPDAMGNLTSEKAKAHFSATTLATNTVTYTSSVAETVNISSGNWTTVTGYITAIAATPTNPDPSTHAYAGIHIGCTFTGGNDVYIDNIVFKEYFPEFTVESNPADGGVTSSNVVTLTFSNAPTGVTTENVSVTGGTAAIESITKVSDTVYAVALSNVEYATNYELTLSGISDTYGQGLNETIAFTTGSGNVLDDNNMLSINNYNFSFETGMFGSKYETSTKTVSVVSAVEEGIEAQHGSKVLKVVNPETPDSSVYAHRVNNILGGKIGKKYIISVWARTVNPAETVTAKLGTSSSFTATNKVLVSLLSMGSAKVTGEWTRISSVIEIIENTSGTKEADKGFHYLLQANGVDIYVDNYQMFEIPTTDLSIVSATPANGSDDASIDVGKIILNISETLAPGFDPVGKVKLYKGNTDVTDTLVSDIAVGFGNSSIELTVGQLENNTSYRVVATDLVDYLDRTATDEITFTTKKAVSASGFVYVDGTGAALEGEIPAGSVAGAQIGVTNASATTIDAPVFVYTVYNPATNELEQIGSSTFAGTYASGQSGVLSNAFTGIENKRVAFYLVNSATNLTPAIAPEVKDFSGADSNFEQGNVKSDNLVYDIDTDANKVTISGKGEAGKDAIVALLGSKTESAPSTAFYTEAKEAIASILSGDASITEANLAGYTLHFAHAMADENGYWSIVLPVTRDASADKVYLAVTTGGSLANDFEAVKVFVPSTATEVAAEASINNASASTLVNAIDTIDYVFGLNTASPVYGALKAKIAAAIKTMNSGTYEADKFTDVTDSTTFKYNFNAALDYYTRQTNAVIALNAADADSMKTILEAYSQDVNVLGNYGGTKLDFNAAYTTYGYLNVNRLLIGNTYTDMDSFINAFNAAVATLAKQQTNPTPGTPANPTKPSGPSGSVGSGGYYVPTTKVPQAEDATPGGFTDLHEAAWAEASILNLVELGVINGMGDGTFRPNGNVTREQFVKMLLLLLGVEAAGGSTSFADVNSADWYAPYVATAYEMGIVNGISETEFGVGQNITRQDIVVMTARACEAAGLDISKKKAVNFEDENAVADYAINAVKLFASAGIINGVSDGIFAPADNSTRAQVAVILDRLYNI